MATVLQFRRYNSTDIVSQTGKVGEIFINLTNNTLNIQNGSTAGGTPLKVDFANVIGEVSGNTNLSSALAQRAPLASYNSHVAGTSDKHIAAHITYETGSPLSVKTVLDSKIDSSNVVVKTGAGAEEQNIVGTSNSTINLYQVEPTGLSTLSLGSFERTAASASGPISLLRLNGYKPNGEEDCTHFKLQSTHEQNDSSRLQFIYNDAYADYPLVEIDPYGDLIVENNLYVGGQIYIDNAVIETVNIAGDLSGNIIPDVSNTYTIGTVSKIWQTLHVGTVNAGAINAFGNMETDHDVEVTDSTKGIILTSPDGSRWRVTVGNDGNLTTTIL